MSTNNSDDTLLFLAALVLFCTGHPGLGAALIILALLT